MEKSNKINDIGIFKTRDVMKMGISKLVNQTEETGISIITSFHRPVCMVLPLSLSGMKRALYQIEKLYKESDNDDEISLSMLEMLNSASKIINSIEDE